MSKDSLIQQLITAFRCLPGVGPKSAQRMTFYLLQRDRQKNPTRRMGLILGMREYFTLAREDLAENGSLQR